MTIVTPTDGRPEAFALLRRWVASQDVDAPLRWVVAGSDLEGYDLSPPPGVEVEVVAASPGPRAQALPRNLLHALNRVGDGPVAVMEDDDYYAPGYLAAYAERLDRGYGLVGAPGARYYHVAGRCRRLNNLGHASLGQTALAGEALCLLRSLCAQAAGSPAGRPFLDMRLWPRYCGAKLIDAALSPLHVGVKGMPGTPGYGIGHRDSFGVPDPGREVFRAWGLPEIYLDYGGER